MAANGDRVPTSSTNPPEDALSCAPHVASASILRYSHSPCQPGATRKKCEPLQRLHYLEPVGERELEHVGDKRERSVRRRERRHDLAVIGRDGDAIETRYDETLGGGEETEDADLGQAACGGKVHRWKRVHTKWRGKGLVLRRNIHAAAPLLISARRAFSFRSGVIFLVNPNGSQKSSGIGCGANSLTDPKSPVRGGHEIRAQGVHVQPHVLVAFTHASKAYTKHRACFSLQPPTTITRPRTWLATLHVVWLVLFPNEL